MSDDNRTDTQTGRLPTADDHRLGGLLAIDVAVFQRLFALLLMAFVIVIITLSLSYSRDARLFPLTVAVPTLGLLVALLLIQTVPSIQSFAESLESSSMVDTESLGGTDWESGSSMSVETVRVYAVRTLAWILLIAVSILLFGHVIGLTLSLIVIFRYYSDLSWVRAVLFALGNVAFITGLFMVAFNARLYPGILFG